MKSSEPTIITLLPFTDNTINRTSFGNLIGLASEVYRADLGPQEYNHCQLDSANLGANFTKVNTIAELAEQLRRTISWVRDCRGQLVVVGDDRDYSVSQIFIELRRLEAQRPTIEVPRFIDLSLLLEADARSNRTVSYPQGGNLLNPTYLQYLQARNLLEGEAVNSDRELIGLRVTYRHLAYGDNEVRLAA